MDVRKNETVEEVAKHIKDKWGYLDVLVNNAAGNFFCPTAELSANGWRAVLDIDLNGTFYCCRHAYPYLKAAPAGGRIISISTTRANSGWPGAAHAGAAERGAGRGDGARHGAVAADAGGGRVAGDVGRRRQKLGRRPPRLTRRRRAGARRARGRRAPGARSGRR